MGARKIEYKLTAEEEKALVGRRNYFVFDVDRWVTYLDKESGGRFDSRVYAPLVYEPLPDLKRGTIAYDDFWDMHDERCLNGYAPLVDGIQYPRITGPHYFYLNCYMIMKYVERIKRKDLAYPDYRTLDHRIFLELEKAGEDGYGIIVGKSRRMGLSYIGSVMVYWNMLFFKNNTCAVGAGKEDKALLLFAKMKKGMENVREEYRASYKPKVDNLRMIYNKKEHGVTVDDGIGSELEVKTFYSDPSAFEGGSYSFFIFEEIGIHDNLIKSYKASEPGFTDGHTQFGVPFLFGTGGEVDKGSRDFKIMYTFPETYNLKKLFIPKYLYYPGKSADEDEGSKGKSALDKLDANVNFFDTRTGMNDKEASLKHILIRRDIARKTKDGYVKECQSNAIKESDIFLKDSGGKLDRLALSTQRERVFNGDSGHEVIRGRYEWVDTDEIAMELARCRTTKEKNLVRIKNNIRVKFVEDANGPVSLLKGLRPINRDDMPYKADIIGVDSYDDEEPVESGSLGCSLVYRCFNGLATEYNMPIAILTERGDGSSDDSFWDNSVKQSVYWNAETLVEYTKTAILTYFKDIYAHKYLRRNPEINEDIVTNNSRQKYGVKMTPGIKGFKGLVLRLLKTEIKESVSNIHFEELLDELIDYGDRNTDIAMAYGVALIHKLDLFDYITEDLQDEVVGGGDVLGDMVYYTEDDEGNLVINRYGEYDNDMMKIEVYDHRQHMTPEERENYINFVEGKRQKELADRKRREKEHELQQLRERQNPFETMIKEFIEKNSSNDSAI